MTVAQEPSASELSHLKALLDGLTDAAVVVGPSLHPILWNTAYSEAVGIGAKRLAREAARPEARCRDLYRLELCERECVAARTFGDGRPVRMHEISGGSAVDGEAAPQMLIVSSVPLRRENGELWAVLESYRDVTAEARVQERYKFLLEQERLRAELLEEQVRVRTADLQKSLDELRSTRAQLIQSEKLSSLGKLVAGVAHEINNPINFIYGNLDFLESYVAALLKVITAAQALELPPAERSRLEGVCKEADLEYVSADLTKVVQSIRHGTERVASIVRDLRQVSHQGDDKMARVQLPSCIDRALNLVSHNTKNRITIERNYAPGTAEVWGNEGRLNQVFMNILINAIQAIPTRGQITINLRNSEGGVAIDITDSGVGIPEDVQLKIFDPFFTTKPVGEGTGLGLSIVFSIIDAHHGRVAVKSQVGKYTTLCVWLPTAEVVAPTTPPVAPTPTPGAG